MNYFLFITGILITVLAVADLIYTVLAPQGSGYFTGKFTRWFWRILLGISSHDGSKRFLNFSGVIILFSLILMWVMLIWLGNTLIFYADESSLFSSNTNQYVTSFTDTAYYTGYVLSSMGNGDYIPVGKWWKIYVGFISYTGVIYMSLSISFLIPVVEAVTMKRIISLRISEIGKNPFHILERHVRREDLSRLLSRIYPLRQDVLKIAQKHLTYPIIHYFHSGNKNESLPLSIVSLDETISILLYGTKMEDEDDCRKLEEMHTAFTYYLSTLGSAFIDPSDDLPELPDTKNYADKLPLTFSDPPEYDAIADRRRLLLAYLQNDGWKWKDMAKNDEEIIL